MGEQVEWKLVDAGPSKDLGVQESRGHYEKTAYADAAAAIAAAQQLADERRHVVRVVATLWPTRRDAD